MIVLGSINADLTVDVARLPRPGETVSGDHFAVRAGGKGANQALAAARAGATVVMAGAVGDDVFAAVALANLRPAGIDLGGVRVVDAPTGIAMIQVAGDGENAIVVAPGANAAVTAADAAALGLGRGDVLLLQGEIPVDALAAGCAAARRAGARTLLNAAPFDPRLRDLLDLVDVLVVNEGEAAQLADVCGPVIEGAPSVAARLGTATLDVVVTRGARGLEAVIANQPVALEALAVDVIDSVGAGDTFCGYLAAGLAAAGAIEPAMLRRASVAASLACTRRGAQEAIPDSAEVVHHGG